MSAPDPLPATVEFNLDLREHLDFMERLYDISQQLGYQFPERVLDAIDLPKDVRLSCLLDTTTGQVWILRAEGS